MEQAMDIAQYIFNHYMPISGEKELDETKLHNLLYLSQRESYAIMGEPLFCGDFYGQEYGPVCRNVRYGSLQQKMINNETKPISCGTAYIVNNIIAQYGGYEPQKLSKLLRKELSWLNSRKGITQGQNEDCKILNDDIRKDAEKIRPYDSLYDMYYDEFDDAEGPD